MTAPALALATYTPPDQDRGDLMWDPPAWRHALEVAGFLAGSQMVPKHFQGKPADVFIALQMAHRMAMDPMTVLQSMAIVNGAPGWKSTFLIARINASGKFAQSLDWEIAGEPGKDLKAVCFTTRKDGKRIEAAVDWKMAVAEKWTGNPKYTSMPHVMFRYRSATFFCRFYAPEILLGLPHADEVEDMLYAERAGAHVIDADPPANQGTGSQSSAQGPQRGMAAVAQAVGTGSSQSSPDPKQSTSTNPAATGKSTSPKANAPAEAAMLRKALEHMPGGSPVSNDIAKRHIREGLGITQIGEARYRDALEHGRAAGWWDFGKDGLMLASAAKTGGTPAADGGGQGGTASEGTAAGQPDPAPAETLAAVREAYDSAVAKVGAAEAGAIISAQIGDRTLDDALTEAEAEALLDLLLTAAGVGGGGA